MVDLGYDPKMGARPLRRTIQDYIEDAITDYYLENPSEKIPQGSYDQQGQPFKSNLPKKAEVKNF